MGNYICVFHLLKHHEGKTKYAHLTRQLKSGPESMKKSAELKQDENQCCEDLAPPQIDLAAKAT